MCKPAASFSKVQSGFFAPRPSLFMTPSVVKPTAVMTPYPAQILVSQSSKTNAKDGSEQTRNLKSQPDQAKSQANGPTPSNLRIEALGSQNSAFKSYATPIQKSEQQGSKDRNQNFEHEGESSNKVTAKSGEHACSGLSATSSPLEHPSPSKTQSQKS